MPPKNYLPPPPNHSPNNLTFTIHMCATYRQILSLLLLILLLALPAIHKLNGAFPPDWFIGKFQDSFLANLPFGLSIAYSLIVFLEVLGPLLLLVSLVQLLRGKTYQTVRTYGFMLYYLLFLILTFGSFLVQDYDNGFKDFLYFVGLLIMERLCFEDPAKT